MTRLAVFATNGQPWVMATDLTIEQVLGELQGLLKTEVEAVDVTMHFASIGATFDGDPGYDVSINFKEKYIQAKGFGLIDFAVFNWMDWFSRCKVT